MCLFLLVGVVREYDEAEGDYDCVTVLSEHAADVKSVRWLPNQDVLISARRAAHRFFTTNNNTLYCPLNTNCSITYCEVFHNVMLHMLFLQHGERAMSPCTYVLVSSRRGAKSIPPHPGAMQYGSLPARYSYEEQISRIPPPGERPTTLQCDAQCSIMYNAIRCTMQCSRMMYSIVYPVRCIGEKHIRSIQQ